MAIPRRNSMERKPHFFKVLLGDFSHSLRIPPAFMKHISKEASSKRTAILEGPSSRVWNVELSEKTNGTYLQDGWQEFAKAHSLRVSEFLVFRYEGNMRFSVRIFDKTACGREDIFTSDGFQEPTFFHGPKKRSRSPKKSLDFCPVVSRQKACEIDSENHYSNSISACENMENHVSNNLSTTKHSFRGKYKPSPKPEGVVRIETEDLDSRSSVAGRVHYLRRRQHVLPEGKGKAQERHIPACFARAHLPNKRVKIILQVPKGKTWEVKINIYRSAYTISSGWSGFSRGNNLEEGDFCIFELVGKLKMCVHIFRLSEENKAQIKSQAI
ncbi:B3 domain-containing protein Os01g0723500-like isoform X2 [Tasmannia lanceolata]|uniref:B3 domain-containing protein Os01g0723500-like isoform X2 n=1 Tax=Tasmannia lanceolata TaxID=3420 RepID=UPI004063D942